LTSHLRNSRKRPDNPSNRKTFPRNRMAAHRRLDRCRDDLCGGGLRKVPLG
jgi:hypothetical protein